jgi:aminoglycoside/choline kinase family phosphotransferase
MNAANPCNPFSSGRPRGGCPPKEHARLDQAVIAGLSLLQVYYLIETNRLHLMSDYMKDSVLVRRVHASAEELGYHVSDVELLPKHGSARRYARVITDGDASRIVMLQPEAGEGAHEVGASAVTSLSDSPFVVLDRYFAEHGVPVPELFGVVEEERVIWLEDLGQLDLDEAQRENPGDRTALYRQAIDILCSIQGLESAKMPSCVRQSTFGHEHFVWELNHYVEWRIEKRLGEEVGVSLRTRLDEEFQQIAAELTSYPTVVSHRDFQSHNLMVRDDGTLVAIDFQDALIAPVVYDLVALLRDSYVVLSNEELDTLFSYWLTRAREEILDVEITDREARRWFDLQTLQRKLKDTGRFEYFALHDRNDGFLPYIPDSVDYVADALAALDAFPATTELLNRHEPLFQQ